MRKIEKKIVDAIINKKSVDLSNTATWVDNNNNSHVYLFRNEIAVISNNVITISLCGWNSVTTRSRINAIFDGLSIKARLFQKKGILYISLNSQVSKISPSCHYNIAYEVNK